MVSVGDGWRDELRKYFRSVEHLTEKALLLIKRDRARNNLPFDESFKEYFLDRTNSRIANVYVDLMYEDRSGEEVNQQSYGNAGASIPHPLASTIIGPESIEHMPILLIQSSNEHLVPNLTASTTFVQDVNQTTISVPLKLPSSVQSEVPTNSNSTQELKAQITLKEEQRAEDEITDGQSIELDSNESNDNLNTKVSRMIMESTSTKANRTERDGPLEKMIILTIPQPETIDLTSDQEDAANTLDDDQNIEGQNIAQPSEQNTSISQTDRNYVQQPTGTDDVSIPSSEKNIKDELATPGDNIDQSSAKGATVIPTVKDQIELVVSSGSNTDANSEKMSSDETTERDYEYRRADGNESATADSNEKNSETIDSNSDQEDAVKNRTANHVSRGIEDVAGPLQPTIHRRENVSGSAIGGKSKEKPERTIAMGDMRKQHKCDYCDYSTKSKSDLTKHIRTHTGERPHECAVCNKRFTRKFVLNTHMKTHRDLFQFQCSNCRQGFPHEMKWKFHESRCKAKGYECHLCKKIFLKKHQLVDHMRVHTGEKLHCSMCRKQFSTDCGLTYHMKTHRALFQFHCSNCRQGFSHEMKWKSHESRCQTKQYECFLCGKKFYHRKDSLLIHMRYKHTGEQPFGCFYCSKRFCQKVDLTHHTKRVHLNDN